MNAFDLRRQMYRRPPMSRATDPMRMNWLWRLICEMADVQATEMVEALQAAQVAVDQQRVRGWSVSDRDDSFFPMTSRGGRTQSARAGAVAYCLSRCTL